MSRAFKDFLGYRLRKVSNVVTSKFEERLRSIELSVGEWIVLREISEAEGPLIAIRISDSTSLTRGAVSKIVAKLEEKNLVTVAGGDGDARAKALLLTKAGVTTLRRAAQLAAENEGVCFRKLSAKDRQELERLLSKIGDV